MGPCLGLQEHGRARDTARQGDETRPMAATPDAAPPPLPPAAVTLDKNKPPCAREDRRPLFVIGNRLWHSDSSFKTTPAKYSLLHAVGIPSKGGNTQFADMRAAYDALDE